MTIPFNRREFVRAFGVGAVGLCLPALRTSEALAESAVKKCFVAVFRANGVVGDQWWPTGSGSSFTLAPSTRPFEPWKQHLVFLKGINQGTFSLQPGDAHQQGVGQVLTARPLLKGPFSGNGKEEPAGWASGASIDQVIAKHHGVESLDLGVFVTGRGDTCSRMSYSDADRPRAPRNDPRAVYDSIFKNLVAPTDLDARRKLERLRARQQSVIDYVSGDIKALSAQLPVADRPKLEAHLDGLRALETKLRAVEDARDEAMCMAPGDPRMTATLNAFPTTGRVQTDLLVAALACGVTRVGSIMWSVGTSTISHPWAGVSGNHHDLSHDNSPGSLANLVKIDTWYSQQFAYLLEKLQAAGLLEHSLVAFVNDLGDGYTHTGKGIPFVLAGNARGALRTGRLLDFGGRNHNDLWTSVANAMDVPLTGFGDPRFSMGPLPGLL